MAYPYHDGDSKDLVYPDQDPLVKSWEGGLINDGEYAKALEESLIHEANGLEDFECDRLIQDDVGMEDGIPFRACLHASDCDLKTRCLGSLS